MNAETVSSQPSPAYGSPGQAIRAARERQRLSLDELASRTRLARTTLEALERDAFDQLLEPVYVRGYYRKCARILNLPEEPLIEAYSSMYTPPPSAAPARLRLASGGELGASSRLPRSLAVIAPIAAIVVCGVIWVMHSARNATPPASPVQMLDSQGNVVMESAPLDGAAQAATAIGGAPGGQTIAGSVPAPADATGATSDGAVPPGTSPSDAGVATAPTPGTVGAAATTPGADAATVANAAAVGGTQLVLQFNAISWARVEDRSGKSLLSGVISAGETRTVDGQPPYSVFLGNAPGVTVQFRGQPVDVKPFLKDNSTARFSVPVQGG